MIRTLTAGLIVLVTLGCDTAEAPIAPATWLALLEAEDSRAPTAEALAVLVGAVSSEDTLTRRLAVRALGRLERPSLVPVIAPLLGDAAFSIRAEAANALGQAVLRADGDEAATALVGRLPHETHAAVRAAALGTLGRTVPASASVARLVDSVLRAVEPTSATETLGITRGLAWRVRSRANASPDTTLVRRLLVLVGYDRAAGDTAAEVRRLALDALARARAADSTIVARALADGDWQVRRLAMVAIRDPGSQWEPLIRVGLADAVGQVRYAALQAYDRAARERRGCAPLRQAVADSVLHVRLVAIELLGRCARDRAARDILVEHLTASEWQLVAQALRSLATTSPDEARRHLPSAVTASNWWLRMAGAEVAGTLRDRVTLRRLAFDPHDNVREAAVRGLALVEGRSADSIYVAQLERGDYQLVMAAARALDGASQAVASALFRALERLTLERRETSRDARAALLERIGSLGREVPPAIEPYLADFDTSIAAQAASLLGGGSGTVTARPELLPRLPLPSLAEVRELAVARPVLVMAAGREIELRLLPFEAPTNVARFARLARDGYYDGLTFHRVVPGFVIQGGSPGANEYMGDGPYTRDEVGLRSHVRGTVGISTRGRDTGDAQIFVNLVDNPRLDHNYTIIAHVVDGMSSVDDVLTGAVIQRIEWR